MFGRLQQSFFLPTTIDPHLPKRLSSSQIQSWKSFIKKHSIHPKTKHTPSTSSIRSRSHEVTTLVTIDSADRDIYNFPSSSSFTIFPGKMFSRITQVEVVSTAIPNLDTVITQYNNTLKWINEEDFDIDYPVYSIVLSTGNYTLANLVARLEQQLNDSKIRRRGGKGPPHVFDVSLNKDTGELEFYSYIARPLGIDSIETVQGSSLVTISLPNHGFDQGDVIRIIFLTDNIGGISPQYFDTDLVIQSVLDSGSFVVDVGIHAASSGHFGSFGTYLGIHAPFKFLLGQQESFMTKLGFPNEDSTEERQIVKSIKTVVGNVSNIDFSVWPCKITTSNALSVEVGDRFNLINFDWGSNALKQNSQTGFTVVSVINPFSFTTTFGLSTNDGLDVLCSWNPTTTRVGFSKLFLETTFPVNTPGLKMRKLTRVDPGREISEIAFRSAIPHGLAKNDIVRISDTDSVPSVDGVYVVSEVYTPIDFTVNAFLQEIDVDASLTINDGNNLGNMYGKSSFAEGSLNHKTYIFKDKFDVGPTEITKPGKNGWINLEQSFELYGLPDFAGLKSNTINDVLFKVRSISLSESNFYQFVFDIPHNFPSDLVVLDGTGIRISSNSFGMNYVQKNTTAGSQFNKGLFLHGEPYFFLCCPSLSLPHNLQSTMSSEGDSRNKHSSVSTLTSSNVQNVLAILLLDNLQGMMVYDSFVTTPKQFFPPLRRLDELKIELRTPRNQLADLQSLDWSFTLKIVEQIERS